MIVIGLVDRKQAKVSGHASRSAVLVGVIRTLSDSTGRLRLSVMLKASKKALEVGTTRRLLACEGVLKEIGSRLGHGI